MERNERDYRDALDGLRFSEEAKERMMKHLTNQQEREQAPEKRRRLHPLRTVLIAACVCLALVGTAFGASAVYRLTVQTGEWEGWGNEYTGYRVYGEPVLHPLEDFSQELQDDFAAWNHPSLLFNQKFDTLEEVKAYLGENIPVVWHSVDSIDAGEYPLGFRVQGYHEMYGDNKLQWVEVIDTGVRPSEELPMVTFHTEMYIYTPDNQRAFLDGLGYWKDESDFCVLDSCTMADGCVAEIIKETRNYEDFEGETRNYIGTFMKDGILYKVDMFAPIQCPASDAELEGLLHEILDSFG